jgi:hypothetical protein
MNRTLISPRRSPLAVWAERDDATHVQGIEADIAKARRSMTLRSSARDQPVSRLRSMPHRRTARSSFGYARIRWASQSQYD